ncbi:nuclear transport factor 2 family protein [Sphingomonas sp.]|uniref:nuclear transport factor 2 family protein n=1 Tax=Sphingomonas sp. TaxID=28214 RepID=UPI003AFF6A40
MAASARLDAIEQIRSLKARYFRFVDTKAWDALEGLFMPDASVVIEEARADPFTPRELADLLRDNYGRCVTIHHGHMPEIDLDGPGSASGIWAMSDERYFDADDPRAPFASAIGSGHYHETYVRTPVGWRIASLRLTRLRLVIVPLSPGG